VASVIGKDPIIAARLLRVANSARYSLNEPVTTLTRAVSVLGSRMVRETVLVTAVMNLLPDQQRARRLAEAFWRHSIGVATAAQVVGRAMGRRQTEELFLAGLLHDIGVLFWLRYFPSEWEAVLETAESAGATTLQCETEILGVHHARLGRQLAKRWRLPQPYPEVIACHHEPDSATQPAIACRVVHVSDVLAHAAELGGPSLRRVPELQVGCWASLGVEIRTLPHLLDMIRLLFRENLELFPLLKTAAGDAAAAEQAVNACVSSTRS
jgi:HD-like signal output (HDOD) protein